MQAFDFFNTLPNQLQKSILARTKHLHLAQGELLYEQGDAFASLVLIKKGKLSVYRHHETGQTLTLYTLDESNNIDVSSAGMHASCIGSAKADEQSEVLIVPLTDIYRLLSKNSDFQEYLFELFMQRNASLAQAMEDLRFKTLDQRVYDWLKQRHVSSLSITHEEIANYHGTRREVISRVLKKFELQGAVKLSRNRIEMIA